MSKGKSDKITYKPYVQNQPYLIPPSADELIPADHPVRLVSEVIDEMGIERLLRKYQVGGGASRYHPVMMTKLFVYGYMTKICSSRMPAKAARENVMYMWLSGNQKPDFRTPNDFRGKLLKGVMEEIFVTAVKMPAGILRERLEQLEAVEGKKKLKKELKTVEKDRLPRKKKYEKAKRICGKRNSYSKTDKDATFMRMKEDHMRNGQLKPGYNVQIGTERGFVVGYDVFPNPTDTRTLKPHLRRQAKRLGVKPKVVITDAGYGSEENYVYLENQGITAAVKYGTWRKEKSRKWEEDILKQTIGNITRKGNTIFARMVKN